MNLEQAEKQLADFNSEAQKGHVDVHKILDFSIDFAELIEKAEMSPNLFTSTVSQYLWHPSEPKEFLEKIDILMEVAEKYIERLQPKKATFEFL